ncbi:MAG: hypothetical protein WCB68_08100 [Pyrinomonadaceae bacterium]
MELLACLSEAPMLEGQVINLNRYWLIVSITSLVAAALVYLRFGFPYKHRNLPPAEPVLLVVLGIFLAASGVKVVYILYAALPIAEDLIIPLIAAAIILFHMGLKDIIKAFRSTEYKPEAPPEKKEGDGN